MQEVHVDFWTTSAQTRPVLALAIVVEARAVISKWESREHRVLKGFQGAIWAIPLIIYTLALPRCFSALAGNAVSNFWVTLIQYGISAGAGALVLNPALEILVKANSRSVAILITPNLAFRIWRTRRRVRHLRRTAARLISDFRRQDIEVRSLRHTIDNSASPSGKEVNEIRAKLGSLIDSFPGRIQRLFEIDVELGSILQESTAIRKDSLDRLEEAIRSVDLSDLDRLDASAKRQP